MNETRIIFQAQAEQPGWETRLDPMGGLTRYLTEHRDFSTQDKIPEVGYRFPMFVRIENATTPSNIGSTHYRKGDWVVTRIERYPAGSPDCDCKEIAICYCNFEPVLEPVLHPLSKPKVTVDSFSSEEAYQDWKRKHSVAEL